MTDIMVDEWGLWRHTGVAIIENPMLGDPDKVIIDTQNRKINAKYLTVALFGYAEAFKTYKMSDEIIKEACCWARSKVITNLENKWKREGL